MAAFCVSAAGRVGWTPVPRAGGILGIGRCNARGPFHCTTRLLLWPPRGVAVGAARKGGPYRDLRISLAGADEKLAQIERRTRNQNTVELGIPTLASSR